MHPAVEILGTLLIVLVGALIVWLILSTPIYIESHLRQFVFYNKDKYLARTLTFFVWLPFGAYVLILQIIFVLILYNAASKLFNK